MLIKALGVTTLVKEKILERLLQAIDARIMGIIFQPPLSERYYDKRSRVEQA
jgi:hypothetical protein